MRNKEELKGSSEKNISWIDEMKESIEREIEQICTQAITLVDTKLLEASEGNAEDTVFYLKMRADYSRYRAEILTEDEK